MSNIILNVIIIAVIFLPMAYFMLSGNKEKSSTKFLQDKLKLFHVIPDTIGCFQSGGIALDKGKSELYFYQYEGEVFTKIACSEIDKADVEKLYQNEIAHGHDINMLKSVSIIIKLKDKSEVKLPVYNASKYRNVGLDLLESVRWSQLINKVVSK